MVIRKESIPRNDWVGCILPLILDSVKVGVADTTVQYLQSDIIIPIVPATKSKFYPLQ